MYMYGQTKNNSDQKLHSHSLYSYDYVVKKIHEKKADDV